ncbi:Legume lectin domain protein [Aquisphaera giovannonii]|uniref:Legume lectin domain protein n=1 Tax=Aquisphaera giovannonii TaxID=406548 RepID=A0A5B9WAH1_9BACT|nr:dockerin type I domain-containing protein [Aquisphaera giovannonii]QEH37254.1 Legume lectin domain protein [Aquisphaera giovannonii]
MKRIDGRVRARRARRARHHRPLLASLEGRLLLSGVDVTQYHNDPYLSGANLSETTLTPGNVNPTSFGLLFSQPVDGYVYAEPLYLSGVTIDGAEHNVAFVATENDTMYAFDADSNAGASAQPLWVHSFTDPAAGITSVPQAAIVSHDIVPTIGITGTPVIDPATRTLYVITKTQEVLNGDTAHPHYVQTLHALDVSTGQDKVPGGYVIGDTTENPDGSHVNDTAIHVAGTGDDSVNGVVTFNATRENQRAALQLYQANGHDWILATWASHGDTQPYHGWLAAFDATTLQPVAWFNVNPNGTEAGIWQSGDPPAYDPATGNIFFATGNGTFDQYGANPQQDYGESVVQLGGTPVGDQFVVHDFFTPYEFDVLNNNDADLGSGGTMLLPDSVGSQQHPHLMVETGKSGKIYLIDRDDMGQVPNPGTGPDANVQTVTAGQAGVWGSPSFLQVSGTSGIIYYHGSGDVLKGYYVSNGHIEDGSQPGDRPILYGTYYAGFPGAQPVVSANGTAEPLAPTDAIVWELQVDQYGSNGPGVLLAYDALNPSVELYDSATVGQRDQLGGAVKFTVPTVANGHVYVGSQYAFSVFGLFPEATAAPATPTGLAASTVLGQGSKIQLSWTNPAPAPGAAPTGIQILRSTDGVNYSVLTTVPGTASSYTDPGPFSIGQPYTYEVVAINQAGASAASAPAQVQITIQPPALTLTNVTASTIALSWTGIANDHYEIQRSNDGVNFATIASVPAGQFSYVDAGLAPGMYGYRVEAFNVNPAASSVSAVRGATVGATVDEGGGFHNTAGLTANGAAQFAEATARLTKATGQVGSVFTNNRLTIGSFTTSFEVRLHEGTQPDYADGITFVIQAGSPTALGQGLGGMGYQGIGHSIAIKLDPFQNPGDPSGSTTGLFINGEGPFGGVDTTGNGLLLNSQAPKKVTITYDGTTLTESIVNTLDASETFTATYQVDIASLIGSDTAYVGFTGSTGDDGFWELQDILDWTFTSTEPLPGAPTAVRGTNPSSSEIDLSWTSNSYNETGFAIERSTDGENFTQVGTTDGTTYRDLGLPVGTYYYRVRAYNDAGYSPYSPTQAIATGTLIDHSGGFSSHSDLSANGNVDWNDGAMQLTNGYEFNSSSSFYTTPVSVLNFTTTFTFQMAPGTTAPPIADGFTFTIQNSGAGTSALGQAGGGLGYAGIGNSVAIKFDAYKPFGDHSSTGLYVNGDYPDVSPPGPGDVYVPLDGTGIDFNAAATDATPHTFQASLSYDGTTLTETITDETTGATFSTQYAINLAGYLNSTSAYVGFTGATGGATSIIQIDSWTGEFLAQPPALLAPWTSEDVGPPAIAGSATYSNGTFTVNASGYDIWNNYDEFHYVSQPRNGDLVAIARVGSMSDTSAWAKAGIMVRDGLDPSASFAFIFVTPGNGVDFQYRDGAGTDAQWNGYLPVAAPQWVMMIRSGNTYEGFTSADGVNWTLDGTVSIAMNDPVQVGLAYDSANDGVLGTATFDHVSVTSPSQLPPGFGDSDVGGPGLPGSGSFDATTGTWTLAGGGSDIWNGADQFHYTAEPFQGDGSISARVASLTYTDQWAKAGVMYRSSLDPASTFVDVVATPGNGVAFQWRDQYGNLGNEQVYLGAPVWVQLVRQGDAFMGNYSYDGTYWYPIGAPVTIDMPDVALAGLALTSHNDGTLAVATFTNVSVLPAGWSDADIGYPGLPGGALYDGQSWRVFGSGNDNNDYYDQLNYASQPFNGSGSIAADVNSLTNSDPGGFAGVGIREYNYAYTAFVQMVAIQDNGVALQWRDDYGNVGSDQVAGISAPVRVKLERTGNVFEGFYSTDGESWIEVGAVEVDMPFSVLAGLAVSSNNNAMLAEAAFADVATEQFPDVLGLAIDGPAVRNQAVDAATVTFSVPVDSATIPGGLSLTRDGYVVDIPAGSVTATLVPGTTATYLVSGLSGLTRDDGNYELTVDATQVLNAADTAAGVGTASTSWLMDATPPTSQISPLLTRQSQSIFAVTVSGTDPSGTTPSGITSFTVYVSANGGAWTPWQTLTPNVTQGSTAAAVALFTGQSNTIYAFYSTATDAAGNTQAYRPRIEASTYVPDLSPPVTSIAGGSYNGDGTISVKLSGHDVGGGLLNYFRAWVSIDGHAPTPAGPAIPAGVPDGHGNVAAAIRYVIPPAYDNGVAHSFVFSTAGIDSSGNAEAAHATAGQGAFSVSYTPPAASGLAISGVTVERGAAERSYIRYIDVAFNDPRLAVLQAIVRSVNSPASGQAPELTLMKYNLDGGGTPVPISLKGLLSVVDDAIEIEFGAGGLGGSPTTTAADGYYALAFKPPSGQGVGSTHHFFRLLGDVTGDGVVDNADLGAVAAAVNQSRTAGYAPLNVDVNGDGKISALDLALATRAKGHKLKSGLPLG